MRTKVEFWMAHVVAIKREGVSTIAYAKRHALAMGSLYRCQRKIDWRGKHNALSQIMAKHSSHRAWPPPSSQSSKRWPAVR